MKEPPTIENESDSALTNFKGKKASGIDNIPTKMLKNLRNNAINELYKIKSDCNIGRVLTMNFIKINSINIVELIFGCLVSKFFVKNE